MLAKPPAPLFRPSHPTAKGLKFAYTFCEGNGTARDAVSGRTGLLSAGAVWDKNQWGYGVNTTSGGLECGTGLVLNGSDAWTVVVGVTIITGGDAQLMGRRSGFSVGTNQFDLNLSWQSTYWIPTISKNNTYFNSGQRPPSSLLNTPVIWAAAGSSAGAYFSFTDNTLAKESSSDWSAAADNGQDFEIGGLIAGGASENLKGSFSFAYLYNVLISQSVLDELRSDPWAAFRPAKYYWTPRNASSRRRRLLTGAA